MPDRPLRVAFLNWRDTGHPEGGGSERYVEQIATGLVERGCAVTFRCSRYAGSSARSLRDGIAYARAGGRLGVYPRTLLALVWARLRGRGFDVVVDVQNGLPFFARLVAGCPVVVLVHHVHREQWPVATGPLTARFGWWIESWLSPRLHRGCQYVTVSAVTRAELATLGVRREHIAVVHNGADAAPVTTLPRERAPRLVVLGRLVPHKRVEDALRVLARLLPELPALRLWVVGDGWWRSRLVDEAERLGVAQAVDFLGYVSERAKHDLLSRAWVMLAPSLKEGWGLMVVEAALRGVPSVAYRNAGGLSESILDDVTGLLVDDLDAMTGATRQLIQDGGLRDALGSAGRHYVSRFDWQTSTVSFLRLLQLAASGATPTDEGDEREHAAEHRTQHVIDLTDGHAADGRLTEGRVTHQWG